MTVKICLVVLVIWVLGLTVAFISGMISDVRADKTSSPEEKKEKIKRFCLSLLCSLAGYLLVHIGSKYTNGFWFDLFVLCIAAVILLIPLIIEIVKKHKRT
ncbi:MAG: hypothetical protein J5710_08520 [Treponema sp.]|nr:hypothetical protein [Treponema sp.]